MRGFRVKRILIEWMRRSTSGDTTHNRVVGGSNPPAATSLLFQFDPPTAGCFHSGRHRRDPPYDRQVAESLEAAWGCDPAHNSGGPGTGEAMERGADPCDVAGTNHPRRRRGWNGKSVMALAITSFAAVLSCCLPRRSSPPSTLCSSTSWGRRDDQ